MGKRHGEISEGLQITYLLPNGLRYPRWVGDGEAVQPEKG